MLYFLEIFVFVTLCLGWGVCAFGCFFCILYFYGRLFECFQMVVSENDWIPDFIQKMFMLGILVCSIFLAIGNWSFVPWEINPWIKWLLVLTSPYLWCIFCDAAILGYLINWKKVLTTLLKL